ncbi:DUF805 domain-containing protein [Sphingomonas bacterium]|uniref:DUF805 domain-containing protein n=1 Tax=Sphingomonas bacterium TaxID=1895847 RepID=UPI00261AAAE2|nr:DUF805 domain-containing protein [Sphingomonas bacterium]MDB5678718.1 hypothetical protein [Sphingomonas bacterium]
MTAEAETPPRTQLAVTLAKAALRYAPDFHGRATRTELFATFAACAVAGALMGAIGSFAGPESNTLQGVATAIVVCLPLIAVMIRRLHDTNRRGISLLYIFMPYAGIVVIGVVLLLNGFAGNNETGPDPRARRRR